MKFQRLTFIVVFGLMLLGAAACSPATPTAVPTVVSTEVVTEAATPMPPASATEEAVATEATTEATQPEPKKTVVARATDAEFVCPEGQAEIVVAAGAVGIEFQLAQEAGKRFNELCPNISVTPLESQDLATDRLGQYIQFLGAKSPLVDVYQVDIVNIGSLAEHFVDLTEAVGPDFADTQFPSMIETGTIDGKLVALPWLIDTGHLYYRTDLLEKYKLEVPKTWDELEAAAAKIQEGERAAGNSEFWGYVWQGAAGEALTCNALEWQASHNGGVIIAADGTIQVNTPGMIAALEQAQGWIGKISPEGVLGQAEEDARAIWEAGNAAFMRNWFYAYGLGNREDSPIRDKFALTQLPAGTDGKPAATLGGQALAVSKYSDNVEAAIAVARFMASIDEQKIRSLQASINPTFPSLYSDAELLAAYPPYADILATFQNAATPRPSSVAGSKYEKVSSLYFNAVYKVLRGDDDATSAMEFLEVDLEDLMAQK